MASCKESVALINGFLSCLEALKSNAALPAELCFVPSVRAFLASNLSKIQLFEKPDILSPKKNALTVSPNNQKVILLFSSRECYKKGSLWLKLLKVVEGYPKNAKETILRGQNWVQVTETGNETKAQLMMVEFTKTDVIERWMDYMIFKNDVLQNLAVHIRKPDLKAMSRLSGVPPHWTPGHDAELVQLISKNNLKSSNVFGVIGNYVDNVAVSSSAELMKEMFNDSKASNWESGDEDEKWIRLMIKPTVRIKKIDIRIKNCKPLKYIPKVICVQGGFKFGELTELRRTVFERERKKTFQWITVLENLEAPYRILQIDFLENYASKGLARVYGLRVEADDVIALGPSLDLFEESKLVSYPLLQGYSAARLAARATVLNRFGALLDKCFPYLSFEEVRGMKEIRHLLPLASKRLIMVEEYLKETTRKPGSAKTITIDRRLAVKHQENPAADPSFRKTVFRQIYDKLHVDNSSNFLYRWTSAYQLWWECNFQGEGIIDGGGGFRDTLCDISAELCPPAAEGPVPLPFFIRTPNQTQADSNLFRDGYALNPGCALFHMYEWIGKLMGACLRTDEYLVLTLPPFFWKQLVYTDVTWSKDYATVDQAEVRVVEQLEQIQDEEAWLLHERTWSVTLSDGTTRPVPGHSESEPVAFVDKRAYVEALKSMRMNEGQEQLAALQRGLLSSVPQLVLQLLTWEELERRVAGSPEITSEMIISNITFDSETMTDHKENEMLCDVLARFSSEDLSHFLRFVSGRQRPPVSILVDKDSCLRRDSLPTSSTCVNTFNVPEYSSVDVAERQIRYAIYHCRSIDNDVGDSDSDVESEEE